MNNQFNSVGLHIDGESYGLEHYKRGCLKLLAIADGISGIHPTVLKCTAHNIREYGHDADFLTLLQERTQNGLIWVKEKLQINLKEGGS